MDEIQAIRQQHAGDHLAHPCFVDFANGRRTACDVAILLDALDTLLADRGDPSSPPIVFEATDC